MNDATHVIFHNDKYCYMKNDKSDWFIDLGDGWENINKWKLIKVYWWFGLKVNIYGMRHKLVKVKSRGATE